MPSSGRAYSGVNIILLWLARPKAWLQPRFLTFRQAIDAGGHVRKGEHGTRICFVKNLAVKDEDSEDDERHVRMLKQFVVFNIAQCDELPEKITRAPTPRHHDARDLTIDEFLAAVGVDIRTDTDQAGYNEEHDCIVIPPFGAFVSTAGYYATCFHELTHWTGHRSRLNRDLSERFANPGQRYAAEELIAELGNAFLCAEFGIDGYVGHADYIRSFISLLKDDPRAIFTCASKAQAAVDFLRALVLREPAQAAE